MSSGDRIMEALERASLEGKGELTKERMPNPLLLNMKPPQYILWVLRSVKSAEFADFASESYGKTHVLPYCPSPQCSGCGIVRSCSNLPSQSASDVGSSSGIETVIKDSPGGARDAIGYNLAAIRIITKVSEEHKNRYRIPDDGIRKDVFKGLGLGGELAQDLQRKSN